MSKEVSLVNSDESESINDDSEDIEGEWSDAEPDEDTVEFRCLYDDESFSDVNSMLIHCTKRHGLDFTATARSLSILYTMSCEVKYLMLMCVL